MTDRHTASTINDEQLDELYDRVAQAEQEADASVAAAVQLTTLVGKRAEKAEAALARLRAVLEDPNHSNMILTKTIRAALTAPGPTAPAATGPRILCANTRPGHHTTVCDLPAGHGDHRGATGYGERVSWPPSDGTTAADTRWQPDETLDYGTLPPPATSPNAQLHTGTNLEQPERTTPNNLREQLAAAVSPVLHEHPEHNTYDQHDAAVSDVLDAVLAVVLPTDGQAGCRCHNIDELCSGCRRCPDICQGCDGPEYQTDDQTKEQ